MGTYTTGTKLYRPTLGETNWDDEINTNFDRLSELGVNVKSYGAVGDDSTLDTTAIQAAIDTGASTIFYPTPSVAYKVGQLTLRTGQRHIAARTGAAIHTTTTGINLFVGEASLNNVIFEGFKIYSSNDADAADRAFYLAPGGGETWTDIAIRKCEIHGFRVGGIVTAGDGTTQILRRVHLDDCYIHDINQSAVAANQMGIRAEAIFDGRIRGCTIKDVGLNSGDIGIALNDVSQFVVRDNTLNGTYTGIDHGGDIAAPTDIAIRDNIISCVWRDGITFSGSPDRVSITGNQLRRCRILAGNGTGYEIASNIIDWDDQTASKSMLQLGTASQGIRDFNVHDNVLFSSATNAEYPIDVAAAERGRIAGNSIFGSIANGFSFIRLKAVNVSGVLVSHIGVEHNRQIGNASTGGSMIIVDGTGVTELEIVGNRVGTSGAGGPESLVIDNAPDRIWVHHNRFDCPNASFEFRVPWGTNVTVEDNICTATPTNSAADPTNKIIIRNNRVINQAIASKPQNGRAIYSNLALTADLPAAAAALDGLILIEDGGAGDRNLIIYAGGQRFRVDGGAAF